MSNLPEKTLQTEPTNVSVRPKRTPWRSSHLVAEVPERRHSLLHAFLAERKQLQPLHDLPEKRSSVTHFLRAFRGFSSELHSRRRLGPRGRRGTRQRRSSGLRAGRTCCRRPSPLRSPESGTCRGPRRVSLTPPLSRRGLPHLSAMATAAFFNLSLLD